MRIKDEDSEHRELDGSEDDGGFEEAKTWAGDHVISLYCSALIESSGRFNSRGQGFYAMKYNGCW